MLLHRRNRLRLELRSQGAGVACTLDSGGVADDLRVANGLAMD